MRRASVCSSVPSDRLVLRVCCCGPGGLQISIDGCTYGGRHPAATALQHGNACSATLSADVGGWSDFVTWTCVKIHDLLTADFKRFQSFFYTGHTIAGVLTCGSCHLQSSARPHPHRAWSSQAPQTAQITLFSSSFQYVLMCCFICVSAFGWLLYCTYGLGPLSNGCTTNFWHGMKKIQIWPASLPNNAA